MPRRVSYCGDIYIFFQDFSKLCSVSVNVVAVGVLSGSGSIQR